MDFFVKFDLISSVLVKKSQLCIPIHFLLFFFFKHEERGQKVQLSQVPSASESYSVYTASIISHVCFYNTQRFSVGFDRCHIQLHDMSDIMTVQLVPASPERVYTHSSAVVLFFYHSLQTSILAQTPYNLPIPPQVHKHATVNSIFHPICLIQTIQQSYQTINVIS